MQDSIARDVKGIIEIEAKVEKIVFMLTENGTILKNAFEHEELHEKIKEKRSGYKKGI